MNLTSIIKENIIIFLYKMRPSGQIIIFFRQFAENFRKLWIRGDNYI